MDRDEVGRLFAAGCCPHTPLLVGGGPPAARQLVDRVPTPTGSGHSRPRHAGAASKTSAEYQLSAASGSTPELWGVTHLLRPRDRRANPDALGWSKANRRWSP